MRDVTYSVVNAAVVGVFRLLGVRCSVQGEEHLPRQGGAVLASNHVSYLDFTFVGLPKVEISSAEFDKKNAGVTIRFHAEVVTATRDKDGMLLEGNGDQVTGIADEWTFARSPKSRDPNWKLVATSQLE